MAKKAASKEKPKTLVLLDAHAIIHRAYHALPDFASSQGEPTGALYGIVAMLINIIRDLNPDYVVACYDLPEKTFRHHAFDGYKAGRQKADDSLVRQIITSREIFEAFGIPMYEAPGFEADDVLGTIVEQTKNDVDLQIVIATGDMDTLQLVDKKRVRVYTLKKGIQDTVIYDEVAVMARYGFGPKQVPDYKGLRGDPSDNIPGVPGIGEKTGSQLIGIGETVENLYKILKKNPEKLTAAGIKDRILGLLREYEEQALFSKTLATIRLDAPITFSLPDVEFRTALSFEKIQSVLLKFEFKTLVGRVRTLMNGEAPISTREAEIVPTPSKVLHDSGEVLRAGIMLWILDSDKTNPTDEEILRVTKTETIPDAITFLLGELEREKLSHVFHEIEEPIIPVIEEMKRYGIPLDANYLAGLSKSMHETLSGLEKKIYEHAGSEFNINSPKQLGVILFETLALPHKGKRGAAGGFSTKSEVLEELEDSHPIVPLIMQYREIQKLVSTYIDAFPKLIADDGRLHATFIQHGTTTGRFSSADPNLQNIPIRSEMGKSIRNGFIASPGHVLIGCDYSQIELRIAAILSRDEKFIQIFQDGKDVHAGVASLVFSVPENEVTYEMRRRAKIINFGILYGMGVLALKKQLGTSREEAQEFLDNYRATFTGIQSYMERVKESARKLGYTETMFGRRRQFAALKSPLPFLRAQAERMAINAPVQGTAADVMKLAIRFIDEDLRKAGFEDRAHLVLQIHDELVFEVEESIADEVLVLIKRGMESVFERSFLEYESPVPLIGEGSIGKHWGEI